MTITADQFQIMVPSIRADLLATYLPLLNLHLPLWGIITPQRVAGFISQIAEESINFTTLTEQASGAEYEGRKDLGNTEPGDGVKFKGRGLIQITGRGNYSWCSQSMYKDDRLLVSPFLLAVPEAGVESACWYFKDARPNLLTTCDHPEDWIGHWNGRDYTKVQWITELVNGGQNGIAQRTANYQRARIALNF